VTAVSAGRPTRSATTSLTLHRVPDPESRALALELANWRGRIDKGDEDTAEALDELKEDLKEIKTTQVEQGKELVSMKTKIALFSAGGSAVAVAIVTFATRGVG
jgi:hypothetical protein